MADDGNGGTQPPKVNERVIAAVVDAYYPAVVDAVTSARTRAQAGYTIAAAIASAIVAAGVLGGFTGATLWVQILGVIALLLWLVAATCYLHAVADGSTEDPGSAVAANASDFVYAILQRTKSERAEIETRTARAIFATYLAVGFTAVVVVCGLFVKDPTDPQTGTLTLTAAGTKALLPICGATTSLQDAQVDPSKLDDGRVEITLKTGCGTIEKPITLRLAKAQIGAFQTG